MELHGVTLEYALDKAKTVTGALRGTHTDIVRQIFKTYIKKYCADKAVRLKK